MTISASVSAPIPEWLLDYRDWLVRASRVDPWPHQSRRPSPQQRATEVEPPLSGAEAQALIAQRRDTTNHYTGKVTTS